MKEDGKCVECQLAACQRELERWKNEALKQAENAAIWEDRARKAELALTKIQPQT